MVVDVHLDERDFALGRLDDAFDDGCELAARATPGRPEIDEHRPAQGRLQHVGAKPRRRRLDRRAALCRDCEVVRRHLMNLSRLHRLDRSASLQARNSRPDERQIDRFAPGGYRLAFIFGGRPVCPRSSANPWRSSRSRRNRRARAIAPASSRRSRQRWSQIAARRRGS